MTLASALASLLAAAAAEAALAPSEQAPPRLAVPQDARLAAYRRIAATDVQVPAEAMDLGPSSDVYRCWRLRLTGERGLRARETLSRLLAVRDAVRRLLAAFEEDLRRRESAAPEALPEIMGRMQATQAGLERLLRHFEELRGDGLRSGLIRDTRRGFFGAGEPAIRPNLDEDAYTMVYDETAPGCPRRAPDK